MILGGCLGVGKRFSRTETSMGFTVAASTRTRTWPAFGSGFGTSSYTRTSGPPYSWIRTAFIAASSRRLVAASRSDCTRAPVMATRDAALRPAATAAPAAGGRAAPCALGGTPPSVQLELLESPRREEIESEDVAVFRVADRRHPARGGGDRSDRRRHLPRPWHL